MAYGFVPVRKAGGGHPTPNAYNSYKIADDYATALIRGDLVKLANDGTIQRAAAGNTIVGVFWGVEYVDDTTGDIKFDSVWTASQSIKSGTTAKAYVYDDPNTVFKAVSDQDTTALASGDEGNLVDAIVAAGSTVTKTSGMSVDSSSKGTGSGGQFKFLKSAEVDEAYTSAGTTMEVYVLPNEHLYKAAVDGI